MKSTVRLRPEIEALAAYAQGKPAPEGGYKLSSNENPYPPLPSVLARLAEVDATVNRYPDGGAFALRQRLAARHGVTIEQVHVAAGSISLLSQFIGAAASRGDEVVLPWRSFEAYPGLITVAGATARRVPNRPDGGHDIDGMIAAITPLTRVVIVCSPNNPTGAVVTSAEFERLMAAVPADVLVLLDEAYREFTAGSGAVDGDTVTQPNVVVLRTFSKAWGLAGLRLGYAVGDARLLAAARSTAIALSVTDQAQQAALVSLDHEDELLERVAVIVGRRRELESGLAAIGWRLPPSWANFVWLPTGAATLDAAEVLRERGVVGRAFAGEGIRVSVGEAESVEIVLDAARDIVRSLQPDAGRTPVA